MTRSTQPDAHALDTHAPVPAARQHVSDSGHLGHDTGACDDCAIAPDRRAFIRHTTAAVTGVLLSLGVTGEVAHALSAVAAVGASRDTRTYAVPRADGVQIDKESRVILVRWLGSVYAFALACPHQNTALTWLAKEERFQCPKHRSQYSADGYFVTGRATRGMDRYAITRDPKNPQAVIVDLHTLLKESDDKDAWTAAHIELS